MTQQRQLTPFTLFGPALGPAWVAPPALGLVATFSYPQNYFIYGYQAFMAGLGTFTGPSYLPYSYVPLPIIAAVIIGIAVPKYNLQTPIQGSNLSNVLLTLQGGLNYIPANPASAQPRPETFSQSDSVALTFNEDTKIEVPANKPVSLYLRLSNNTQWDSAGFQLTMYTMNF